MRPTLWLIAGPNGAGKTTYARRFLRTTAGTDAFVNVDEIARGLSPLRPSPDGETARAAARYALDRVATGLAGGRSFAVETTLAGLTHLRTLDHAANAGFDRALIYATVPDVGTCVARIAARIAAGGHAVPEEDVRRRFVRSAANFARYTARVERWVVLDTRLAEPRPVASGSPGGAEVHDPALLADAPPELRAAVGALTR